LTLGKGNGFIFKITAGPSGKEKYRMETILA
jgi:hypothetical protein